MKGRIIGQQERNIKRHRAGRGRGPGGGRHARRPSSSTASTPCARLPHGPEQKKLVADGRIHPARIEKEVQKATEEIERVIAEAGEQAMIETNNQGLHREIQRLLGGSKFRTSYRQIQLRSRH
ncbi:MAG: hypothetical protein R3A10_07010 [Caldilineaceae bacterium]